MNAKNANAKNARQQIPSPVLEIPPAPPPPERAPPQPAEPPKPRADVTPTSIELTRPTIYFGRYIFISRADGNGKEQVDKITPETAFIAHGCVVITERNLILPLAGIHIEV